MKNLVFDVETTGLPQKGLRYSVDYLKFPYIVQFSWLFDGQMNDFIIYPDGYEINNSEIHGITTEIALEKGVTFDIAVELFIEDCEKADKLIGHNIYFDVSMIKANIRRYSLSYLIDRSEKALDKTKRVDTMTKSMKYVNARANNRIKFPTLIELHQKLFGIGFDAHNSKNDVAATNACYHKLREIGIL